MIRFFVISVDDFFVTIIFSPVPSIVAFSAVGARNTSTCEERRIAFSLFSSLYSNFWHSISSYPKSPQYWMMYSFTFWIASEFIGCGSDVISSMICSMFCSEGCISTSDCVTLSAIAWIGVATDIAIIKANMIIFFICSLLPWLIVYLSIFSLAYFSNSLSKLSTSR